MAMISRQYHNSWICTSCSIQAPLYWSVLHNAFWAMGTIKGLGLEVVFYWIR